MKSDNDFISCDDRFDPCAIFRAGTYLLSLHENTLVMGILNITPDSFSDGGRYLSLEKALGQAKSMID